MEIAPLVQQAVESTDTLAQVAASLYIAIAVFSGEQVATALKGQRPQIRINPRRYIEYLNLPKASIALLLLIAIKPVYMADIFPGTTLSTLKMSLGMVALTAVLGCLFWIIRDTLIHRDIEKRFGHIAGSTSRLIAWALMQEVDAVKGKHKKTQGKIEQLKLIDTLFGHENDTNLEKYMLTLLSGRLHDILAKPQANQEITSSLLSALRTLRDNIGKRPLRDVEYYKQLFELTHLGWHKAATEQPTLQAAGIFQILALPRRLSRELMKESIADPTLVYDYALNAASFMEEDPRRAKDYKKHIAYDLEERLANSPAKDWIGAPPLSELRELLQKTPPKPARKRP